MQRKIWMERLKVFPNYRPGSSMGYMDGMLLYFLDCAEKTYKTPE